MNSITYKARQAWNMPLELVTITAKDEKGTEYLEAYEQGRLQLTTIIVLARMGRGLEMAREEIENE